MMLDYWLVLIVNISRPKEAQELATQRTATTTGKVLKLHILCNQTIQTFLGGHPTHNAIDELPILEKQKGWPTIHIESFRHIRTIVDSPCKSAHCQTLPIRTYLRISVQSFCMAGNCWR